MKTEIIPYAGWERNMRFANGEVELVVSLEVGPRIMSYRRRGGSNMLKNYSEQLGRSGEEKWMIRGGHRLWLAPEDRSMTYHLDNKRVDHEPGHSGQVRFTTHQEGGAHIRKDLLVHLDSSSSKVTIEHKITNKGDAPLAGATWGLTVMAPGGLEILPMPPFGSHEENLLPNRVLVLWPYTDLDDERLVIGRNFVTLRQEAGGEPLKFGLRHEHQWAAYLLGDCLFIKTFGYDPAETYPDFGCNFETFTNGDMLEIESLGPLRELAPGESVSHREAWFLFTLEKELEITSEEALADWISPYIGKVSLP